MLIAQWKYSICKMVQIKIMLWSLKTIKEVSTIMISECNGAEVRDERLDNFNLGNINWMHKYNVIIQQVY